MITQNAEKESDGFGSIEAKRYAPAVRTSFSD
jgi:hypothetical protein